MRPLPGRHALKSDFLTLHQRQRITTALAEVVSEKGFEAVTVGDVVKRAGIARNTFYENFSSKEDCFLAAQEQAMSTVLERVRGAAAAFESWPERVRGEEPALARVCVVEVLAAGPAAIAHYEESQQTFVSLFRLGRDVSPRQLPETLEEAIVGGVFWIVYQRLVAARAEGIPELLPELVEFSLTPYLGAEAAAEIAHVPDPEGAWAAPSS